MPEIKLDTTQINVALAMPINRHIPWQTAMSLLETQMMLVRHGIKFTVQFTCGYSYVHIARNCALDTFLKSDCTHMFWLDCDMAWNHDDFLRFLGLSTVKDIICATYPLKSDPVQFRVRGTGNDVDGEPDEYGCVKIGGTGMGFFLITRKVLEEMAESAPRVWSHENNRDIAYVFRTELTERPDGMNDDIGEDIGFVNDLRAAGHDVWMDPNISLTHVGEKAWTASLAENADV